MLVHIAGNISDVQTDPPIFRAIIKTLHEHEAMLALGWIESKIHSLDEKHRPTLDWTAIVTENIDAIKRADLVIIEITKYNFSQGFQLAAALEYKKPTLVVYRDSLQGSIITGFKDQLFSHQQYDNINELQERVSSFIKKHSISTKDLRFNFLIDRKINQFLNDAEEKTGKSKSEIIRSILTRKIKERNQ